MKQFVREVGKEPDKAVNMSVGESGSHVVWGAAAGPRGVVGEGLC